MCLRTVERSPFRLKPLGVVPQSEVFAFMQWGSVNPGEALPRSFLGVVDLALFRNLWAFWARSFWGSDQTGSFSLMVRPTFRFGLLKSFLCVHQSTVGVLTHSHLANLASGYGADLELDEATEKFGVVYCMDLISSQEYSGGFLGVIVNDWASLLDAWADFTINER